jgi:hypothetical protein
LINEAVPFPLELDGIEADQGAVNMEEIIAINDEMHEINIATVSRVSCPKINIWFS